MFQDSLPNDALFLYLEHLFSFQRIMKGYHSL